MVAYKRAAVFANGNTVIDVFTINRITSLSDRTDCEL